MAANPKPPIKLTDAQEWVLRRVYAEAGNKANKAVATADINVQLYESDLNRRSMWGGERWSSRSEAANPHLTALSKEIKTRPALLERSGRGQVKVTKAGAAWIKENTF